MTAPLRSPFEGSTLTGLRAALQGLSQRQSAIANNIANVDTPNYQASDMSFEAALAGAMGERQAGAAGLQLQATAPGHILEGSMVGAPGEATAVPVRETARRNDGNNVDLDREMARLAETGLRYQAVATQVAARYAQIRSIISDGRR